MKLPSRHWWHLTSAQFAATDMAQVVALQPVAAVEQHDRICPCASMRRSARESSRGRSTFSPTTCRCSAFRGAPQPCVGGQGNRRRDTQAARGDECLRPRHGDASRPRRRLGRNPDDAGNGARAHDGRAGCRPARTSRRRSRATSCCGSRACAPATTRVTRSYAACHSTRGPAKSSASPESAATDSRSRPRRS